MTQTATVAGEPARSAQRIVDVLSAQGVQYIFGVPGAKIDAVYDALLDGGPQLVVCAHNKTLRSWPRRSDDSPAPRASCW